MSDSAVVSGSRPRHAALQRPGAKRQVVRHLDLPPWSGWTYTEEWRRIVRWIEETLVQPVGVGAGRPMRVAKFQRKILRELCDSMATLISIPAGNGKTTLMAAVALERVCRGDDYVNVDVLATQEAQARRLVELAIQLIECSPALSRLADQGHIEFYKDAGVLEYRPTGSRITAYPAKLSTVQGLNSDLALVDEIAMVPGELFTSMLARVGKKGEGQRVCGFGTPGFELDNMLEVARRMAHSDELPAGAKFIEFAADAGCSVDDEVQHRKANPAIEAGFLDPASLPLKAAFMVEAGREHEFRAYHLGQPVESSGPWLPYGAWDACVDQRPPADGTPVVLGVWGNYRRQVAVVGGTLDGALFFGWQAEKPSDVELGDVLRRACDQWDVMEITYKPHIRLNLMAQLDEEGLPVVRWPADSKTDADSTSEMYKTIAEQELAHDHDPTLSEQVARLTAKVDTHGNPRLVEAESDVSAALAARAAWWRARVLAEEGVLSDDRWAIY